MDSHPMQWDEPVAEKIIHPLEKRGMEGSYAAKGRGFFDQRNPHRI
jgi:PII-like signaling protein